MTWYDYPLIYLELGIVFSTMIYTLGYKDTLLESIGVALLWPIAVLMLLCQGDLNEEGSPPSSSKNSST